MRKLLIIVFALAGCATEDVARPVSEPAPVVPVLPTPPVTYAGNSPCADCPGQRLTVTLFVDETFRVRHTYLGVAEERDDEFFDLGRWSVKEDSTLVLRGGTEAPRRFRVVSAEVIRMLDSAGREIRSELNYDLSRQNHLDPVDGPMFLTGLYTYMADAASLVECLTGKRYPVLIEADHLAVERAYLDLRNEPAEAVFLTIDGRFVARRPEPGLPLRDHVIVERFRQFWPGQSCPD